MSQFHQFDNREYNYSDTPFYNYSGINADAISSPDLVGSKARSKDRKEKTARVFKVIITVLIFVIFVQLVYHLYFARNMYVDKVLIGSDLNFSAPDEQILEMAGISSNESFFALDAAQVEMKLERYPQIASASVEKKFPDTLKINLIGRNPLAVCLMESEGRIIPAAIDSEGVIFQIGKSVTELNLPVLSGVRINEARLGSVMPAPVAGFLESLENLRNDSPAFFNSISEVRIIRKSSDDFEVLMYPQNYSIPVRMGSRVDKELFTYIMLVLDVVKQQGMAAYLEELDFRTDEVVYRVRGE